MSRRPYIPTASWVGPVLWPAADCRTSCSTRACDGSAAADQLAVAHRALGVADHRDDAVLHGELLHRHRQLLRRALEQEATGLGRPVAQRDRAVLDSGPAERAALVPPERGVPHHHLDAIE